jgi:hypothetical protein
MPWGFNDRFRKFPHLEQYNRIKRWQEALRGVRSAGSIERELDIVYAYFMNCYHLRDWLVESRVIDKKTVDDFFENEFEMRICRDLCNASKHLVLHSASFKGDPNIPGDMVTMFREYHPSEGYELGILVGGHKFHISELASRCVQLWTEFLGKNDLL